MILQPAWKLLNVNLGIYTEISAYDQTLEFEETDTTAQVDRQRAIEDCKYHEIDRGSLGMTMSLIELLTTLSSKGSVRLGVKEGMLPLILTVASYMVLQFSEMEKLEDHTQYIIVNDSDTYEHTVRNYCRAFLS